MRDIFYKPLKIKEDESNVFFWSDLHMGQACTKWDVPLWKMRGFDSLEQHDEMLITRWNETVNNTSTIFHLGDILFGENGEERLRDLLAKLNFKNLYLLPGNHTAGFKQMAEKGDVFYYGKGDVIFCPNYIEAFINKDAVAICHYALASWNGQGGGSYMIHGHSHGSLYNGEVGKLLYTARIMDVGVENCPYPLSFKEVKEKLDKEPVSHDHHNRNTQNPF